jgi:hypothetical protein
MALAIRSSQALEARHAIAVLPLGALSVVVSGLGPLAD